MGRSEHTDAQELAERARRLSRRKALKKGIGVAVFLTPALLTFGVGREALGNTGSQPGGISNGGNSSGPPGSGWGNSSGPPGHGWGGGHNSQGRGKRKKNK